MTLFSNVTSLVPCAQVCPRILWSSPFKCTSLCSSQTLRLIISWLNRTFPLEVPSCAPEVSGREAKLYTSGMSVFVLLSLQEPAYRMCISHNIGFTASCLMTRTVITKVCARRSPQTRGCVCVYCMSGCVRGDPRWSASSAPVDSHLLPPSSTAQSRMCTSQLSAVNSGDRRKTSYPPRPALLCSITLLCSRESR